MGGTWVISPVNVRAASLAASSVTSFMSQVPVSVP